MGSRRVPMSPELSIVAIMIVVVLLCAAVAGCVGEPEPYGGESLAAPLGSWWVVYRPQADTTCQDVLGFGEQVEVSAGPNQAALVVTGPGLGRPALAADWDPAARVLRATYSAASATQSDYTVLELWFGRAEVGGWASVTRRGAVSCVTYYDAIGTPY